MKRKIGIAATVILGASLLVLANGDQAETLRQTPVYKMGRVSDQSKPGHEPSPLGIVRLCTELGGYHFWSQCLGMPTPEGFTVEEALLVRYHIEQRILPISSKPDEVISHLQSTLLNPLSTYSDISPFLGAQLPDEFTVEKKAALSKLLVEMSLEYDQKVIRPAMDLVRAEAVIEDSPSQVGE